MDRIASTLQNGAEMQVSNQPCENGGEASHSDLCAQWKAANAAETSANAAWLFGALGCLIGGATLIAAVLAAKYAKKAADHTESGAREARRAADAAALGIRPHLYIGDVKLTLPLTRKSAVILCVKNHGMSPAINVRMGLAAALVSRPIGDSARDLRIKHFEEMPSFGPQYETRVTSRLSPPVSDADLDLIRNGKAALILRHIFHYEGVDETKDILDLTLYIDRETLTDGEVDTLNEWARFHSHEQAEVEEN